MRYNVAQQLPSLAEGLDASVTCSALLPSFSKLLGDGESEVRAAAAGKLAQICRLLSAAQARRSQRPCP